MKAETFCKRPSGRVAPDEWQALERDGEGLATNERNRTSLLEMRNDPAAAHEEVDEIQAAAPVQCWPFAGEEDRAYHDAEWGVPTHDDTHMFEHLCLECLQCGLSWNYVLVRRDLFRAQFHGFDIDAVAVMTEEELRAVMEVPGILRNFPKLRALVNNARCAQRLRGEFGGLAAYFWHWTDGKTILYMGHQKGGVPVSNGLSARIAADLKRRGFKYVGPVNIYAHLQACGIVCDHRQSCPRYAYVTENFPCVRKRRDAEIV